MWTLILAAALAAPPSSTLTGDAGTLAWTVTGGDTIEIVGRSPKWTVTHVARPDLQPLSSTREAGGHRWTVTYDSAGATITSDDGATRRVDQKGLWDGDTLDVRLGAYVAGGGASTGLHVLDPEGGKAWSVNATVLDDGRCAVPCTHVRVQLAGAWRLVGPTWDYWYAGDGRLVTFDGPIGRYTTADGVR